ncbi:hypothetical protein ACMZOO_00900 [Catenovulum sp. SX2]|uniref:hypothetical protein n=1 Tax=Catenovulum sp. SX2 TaxID=3398614 RepID=UPI003F8358F8
MDIVEYYNKAKILAKDAELNGSVERDAILSALAYSEDDDHPRQWIPKVQTALIKAYKICPNSEFSNALLELFEAGVILQNHSNPRVWFVAVLSFLVGGVLSFWLLA